MTELDHLFEIGLVGEKTLQKCGAIGVAILNPILNWRSPGQRFGRWCCTSATCCEMAVGGIIQRCTWRWGRDYPALRAGSGF